MQITMYYNLEEDIYKNKPPIFPPRELRDQPDTTSAGLDNLSNEIQYVSFTDDMV